MGSLTGAVASQRVAEAFKGWLGSDGNRIDSASAKASLTVRTTIQADTKVGASDPSYRPFRSLKVGSTTQTDKSYAGDNRLIAPNSSHRRRCLAPRCRLISSWGRSRSQGSGCSPVKEVRELGSERKLHCVLPLRSGKMLVYIALRALQYEFKH
jgi:hypothetical protein